MHLIRPIARTVLFAVCLASLSCGEDNSNGPAGDQHKVYFVGYVYDGARGVRLDKSHLGSVTIKYRDKTITTEIETDGRYVSKEPLPTWQDYAVTIVADGYRPFISRNGGIDVPASLSMTDGVAAAATTQTFAYDAYLFPTDLKAPKVTVTIDRSDEFASNGSGMTRARATGTIRLRPTSSSLVDVTSAMVPGGRSGRRWANDEDLLTQTITKPFTEGRVEFAEGELIYGVAYQIAIFDVDGYQPQVTDTLVAGSATSRMVMLTPEARDPLRIVSSTVGTCMPPAGTANAYAAEVKLTFNEAIELVGNTFAEDIDNGVSFSPTGYTGPMTYCQLNNNVSPSAQEHGTRVTIDGSTITLAFNPSLGINSMSPVGCTVPAMLTSVTYGNLQAVTVRPAGDTSITRRRTLGDMVQQYNASSGIFTSNLITCPTKL